MKKKLVELVIGEDGLENLGVDAIALVENPAIEKDFLYFKEEKFVEPRAGEDEGEFIGRCMSALEGEFPDQDQRLAVCYSYWQGSEEEFLRENPCLPGYVAYGTKMKDGREVPNCVPDESAKKFGDEMNLDILGYATKNFEICPGAINTFKRLAELGAGNSDLEGMIRSAALQADAVFGIEKAVLANGVANKTDLYQAAVLVLDFQDLIAEIEKIIGEKFPVDYMMGHLEVIGNLIPDSEFALDPSALPTYIDQITEDEEKKKDELVIPSYNWTQEELDRIEELANKLGFAESECEYAEEKFATKEEIRDSIMGADYTPVRRIKQDEGKQTVYKYVTPKSIRTRTTRDFCSVMPRDRFYTREEIRQLNGSNPGFGINGAATYDVFLYKGGPWCKHGWKKYEAERVGSTLRVLPAKMDTYSPEEETAYMAPRDMRYNGYISPRRDGFSGGCGCEDNSYHFNDEQRIATGPAMIPDYEMARKADDGSKYYVYFSEDTIRQIAEKFMREKRVDSTNIEHDSADPRPSNYVYESWIVEDPEMDKAKAMGFNVPKGTWMVSMRVGDETTWKLIKQGKIKGFSVEGFFGEMVQK